ncbi:hypothetical protein CEXT_719731 [Caerostris extrusa]|uniref:Uncharacterized protein n=1 Tax=Caerostris extrusa TaxID=172846 RepID=A0AAV4W1H3_CAEEX|nr:hypothetical protein CEXT_719731 [Caerostris extrusa]
MPQSSIFWDIISKHQIHAILSGNELFGRVISQTTPPSICSRCPFPQWIPEHFNPSGEADLVRDHQPVGDGI